MHSSHLPILTARVEGTLLPVDLYRCIDENGAVLSRFVYQQVRLASKQKGTQTHVERNLPPDVLGIYVYLPKA